MAGGFRGSTFKGSKPGTLNAEPGTKQVAFFIDLIEALP